jgi:hypothetical protein
MVARTTSALALRPTGNDLYSLTTGCILNRSLWTLLPIPAEVIERMHVLARHNKSGLAVKDRLGNPIDSDFADAEDDDSSWHPVDDADDDNNEHDSRNYPNDIDGTVDDPDDPVLAAINAPISRLYDNPDLVNINALIAGVYDRNINNDPNNNNTINADPNNNNNPGVQDNNIIPPAHTNGKNDNMEIRHDKSLWTSSTPFKIL